MHVYSINRAVREKVIVILFFTNILLYLILNYILKAQIDFLKIILMKFEIVQSLFQSYDFLDIIIHSINISILYTILYFFFDKILWKIKWINKYLSIPNLNGRWTGSTISSSDKNNNHMIEIKVEQTWSKIKFISTFSSTNSISESNCTSFFIENNGDKKISIGFVTKNEDVNSQKYDGYCILKLDSSNKISGQYFDNSNNPSSGCTGNNTGQFKVTRETIYKRKNNMPKTQEKLLIEFAEINPSIAEKIDINIKAKILKYQSTNINKEISNIINKELSPYINKKNTKKITKKCNKLAAQYIENNRIWMLQENWYCLLSYLITVATMVLRLFDITPQVNDWITFIGYFIVLFTWIVIVQTKELMGEKAENFLAAFNNHAPSITILSMIIFYLVVCTCSLKIVWFMAIILPFVACVWFTWYWYKNGKL